MKKYFYNCNKQSKQLLWILLLSLMISCNLYAEPGKQNERRDFPVNASEDHKKRKLIEPTYEQQGWENSRFSAMKADKEKKKRIK